MKEQELRNIWMRSSEKENITIDTTQLIDNFKMGAENRERIVRLRDRREIIAAFIGISIHIYIVMHLPFSIPSVGAILATISLCYFIYKLRIHRKSRYMQDLFLPLKEQLQNQRQFMINQAKLLDTVLYWGFLPFFISYMIFIWGSVNMEAYDSVLITKLKVKVIATIVMIAYGIYIVRLNKRAARVNWEPLIKQIDTILHNLKSEEK